MANTKKIEKVMKNLEKYYGKDKRTTLNSMRQKKNPFKILIACLISLRTRDENTDKVVKKLFSQISSPKEIIQMPLKKLEKIIYSSGHYKKKAKTLKHVSREILEKYNGKVPSTPKQLIDIKGIGKKTCNVVLNFAFNKYYIPVDVNVHRISNRLGWVKTKNADKTEEQLTKILPKKYWKEINALFILHGKRICVPISPWCSKCPVNKSCKQVNITRKR